MRPTGKRIVLILTTALLGDGAVSLPMLGAAVEAWMEAVEAGR